MYGLQINNAGIARGKTILETKPEEFLLTYKVNVLGCHNILREFLPHSELFSFMARLRYDRTDARLDPSRSHQAQVSFHEKSCSFGSYADESFPYSISHGHIMTVSPIEPLK